MEWLKENYMIIIPVLFALSEALAMIPALKSNSIFQLIVNVIKWLNENMMKKEEKK